MPVASPLLLALTYLGFVSLGLPDATTGVVWPSVSSYFRVPLGNLGVLLMASASGYLVSSLLIGRLLQRLGVGGLLTVSCALIAISLAGFTLAPAWALYVASGVIAGLGAGAIDTGLNAYAARHFSARHMNWLHACWGVGATVGAITAASVLAQGLSWQWIFALLGIVMTALTLTFALTLRIWQPDSTDHAQAAHDPHASPIKLSHALRHPVVWVQGLVFFIYVGVETTAAQWAFTLLTQYRDVLEGAAGTALSLYWGSLTAGRFLLGAIADRVGVQRLVSASITTGLVGGLSLVLAPWPWLSVAGLVVLGASLAPIYPGLMSQTPHRLGGLADMAVGFQVAAAMLGQVIVPSIGGLVLKAHGLAWLNGMLGVLLVLLWVAITGLFWGAPLARWSKRVAIPFK